MKKPRDVFYYRIVDHHKELVGNDIPVNTWQLYSIVKTEILFTNWKARLSEKYYAYLTLKDVLNPGQKDHHINNDMRKAYPWDKLIKSISEEGIKIPVLIERFLKKEGGYSYDVIEGKHRIAAASLIKPLILIYQYHV